jgi:hypothetical protein
MATNVYRDSTVIAQLAHLDLRFECDRSTGTDLLDHLLEPRPRHRLKNSPGIIVNSISNCGSTFDV